VGMGWVGGWVRLFEVKPLHQTHPQAGGRAGGWVGGTQATATATRTYVQADAGSLHLLGAVRGLAHPHDVRHVVRARLPEVLHQVRVLLKCGLVVG
jgi:hypothetical protein